MTQFSFCNSHNTIKFCGEAEQIKDCEKFRYNRVCEVHCSSILSFSRQAKVKCNEIDVQQIKLWTEDQLQKNVILEDFSLFLIALCSPQCLRNPCEQDDWHCLPGPGGCFWSNKALPLLERLRCNSNIIAFCQFSFAWTTWLVTL